MAKVIIQNIGPISEVEIEINKVNVIIGPQSSGKSTIAKIYSYCQWLEKRYILDGGKIDYTVSEGLLKFHRFDNDYFSEKSFFQYEGEFVTVTCRGKDLKQDIHHRSENSILEYKRSKNIYIPAERNFVSVIPNLGRYNETNDNIMSFLYDWYAAKRMFTEGYSLPVLGLDIDFYHNEESDRDIIRHKGENKEIQLRSGSSGLQSVVPLVVNIEYLTSDNLYKNQNAFSVKENNEIKDLLIKTSPNIIDFNSELRTFKMGQEGLPAFLDILDRRLYYHHTNFIMEEPEQNLFPATQRDLIYYIFNKLQSGREHSLFITTHSPYILYAINNCLMGAVISGKLNDEEKLSFPSSNSWLSPDKINLFEIEEGRIRSIKNPDTGTVDKHYFNRIMKDIMNEYYDMLNYFA